MPKPDYPQWLREAASRGGKRSRRKLSAKQARAMVRAREAKKLEKKL